MATQSDVEQRRCRHHERSRNAGRSCAQVFKTATRRVNQPSEHARCAPIVETKGALKLKAETGSDQTWDKRQLVSGLFQVKELREFSVLLATLFLFMSDSYLDERRALGARASCV